MPIEFSPFCKENGIIQQSMHRTLHNKNELDKRKNQALLNKTNAMILNAKLLMNLWGETLLTACHVHNRIIF